MQENYYILYENFIFEKNIEKLENNSKIKLSLKLMVTKIIINKKIINNLIYELIKKKKENIIIRIK